MFFFSRSVRALSWVSVSQTGGKDAKRRVLFCTVALWAFAFLPERLARRNKLRRALQEKVDAEKKAQETGAQELFFLCSVVLCAFWVLSKGVKGVWNPKIKNS